jgi:hypothetical protein
MGEMARAGAERCSASMRVAGPPTGRPPPFGESGGMRLKAFRREERGGASPQYFHPPKKRK